MESLNDVGSITYFNADGSIHETVTFNNQERYLEEAKEALKTRGITGWKCNTLSKDLNLHYELYKMIADEVDDDAMSRGEYARQHPELQKTEEIERTTQAAIRTDSKYQQAEQRRPKVSNLTNAIQAGWICTVCSWAIQCQAETFFWIFYNVRRMSPTAVFVSLVRPDRAKAG